MANEIQVRRFFKLFLFKYSNTLLRKRLPSSFFFFLMSLYPLILLIAELANRALSCVPYSHRLVGLHVVEHVVGGSQVGLALVLELLHLGSLFLVLLLLELRVLLLRVGRLQLCLGLLRLLLLGCLRLLGGFLLGCLRLLLPPSRLPSPAWLPPSRPPWLAWPPPSRLLSSWASWPSWPSWPLPAPRPSPGTWALSLNLVRRGYRCASFLSLAWATRAIRSSPWRRTRSSSPSWAGPSWRQPWGSPPSWALQRTLGDGPASASASASLFSTPSLANTLWYGCTFLPLGAVQFSLPTRSSMHP